MNKAALWAFVGAIASVVVLRTASQWESGRAGQLVFRPVSELSADSSDRFGELEIRECEPLQDGLMVTGWVGPGSSPRVVLVTQSGRQEQEGRRVGAAFQAQTRPGSDLGDFVILLRWASKSSRFALAANGMGAPSPHGPVVACP